MKRTAILVILSLLTATAIVNADDYIRMDQDYVHSGTLYFNVDFYWLRESAYPPLMMSGANGFVITSPVPTTWEVVDIEMNPAIPGSYVIGTDTNGVAPDTFVVGFFDLSGIPPFSPEEHYFTIRLHIGYDGLICFDSTWVPPDLEWQWGSGAIVPDLLGGSSQPPMADHCLMVGTCPCGPTRFIVTPEDDQLPQLAVCGDAQFEFVAYNMILENHGYTLFRVADGPGTVTSTSDTSALYVCPALPVGTYPVVLEAQDTGPPDYSFFDVIFQEGSPPPGDANCSMGVDIDDAVYLITYIFGAGPAPLCVDDPDCSGEFDIDDVVYLIEYIFGGGPAPQPCE